MRISTNDQKINVQWVCKKKSLDIGKSVKLKDFSVVMEIIVADINLLLRFKNWLIIFQYF